MAADDDQVRADLFGLGADFIGRRTHDRELLFVVDVVFGSDLGQTFTGDLDGFFLQFAHVDGIGINGVGGSHRLHDMDQADP